MEFEAVGPFPITTVYAISKCKTLVPTFGLVIGE